MNTSLIRSRVMITGTPADGTVETIEDGALLQENGTIVEVGTYDTLRRRFPTTAVVGDGTHVMLPGFVNAHHHVGLTPVQLGSPDMPLELWFITRLVCRNVDPYLDTLYSAFEMIASGVTTVQHIHGWLPGDLPDVEHIANEVLRAYDDIGMRASYCYAVRDQNRLVYQDDAEFVASLPSELQAPMQRWFDRFRVGLDESIDLYEHLRERFAAHDRLAIQLAPANLHWCSDRALERLADVSARDGTPMHMHLVETAYQKAYAERRGGGTALDYLDRFDMLTPRLTLGHGVWLNQADIERMADTGVRVCHNCSSNFRLRSGIAPLNAFERHGIDTGIGLDEAGINDDRDMLQELKLVLRAHRVPGMDNDEVPSCEQVLRMATEGGARTTPFGDSLGRLEVGRAADLSLVDHDSITWPYLDPETPLVEAVVQRASASGVRTVMCAGDVVYRDGVFTRVDRTQALRALHEQLQAALSDDEVERRQLSKALLPHVRAFYDRYMDPRGHEPFYRSSSRV